MKALVTGATGYLGFHLCQHLLEHDWEVHALVRSGSDAARVAALGPAIPHQVADDLGDLAGILGAAAPEAVFNLAAAMPGQTDHLALANEGLPGRLGAGLAGLPGAVLIHAASWWEWDEDGKEAPANPYAASKAAGRRALQAVAAQHGFRLASLVLHDTYGPADWRGKILDHMLDAALHGREILLTPGEQMMDLVYVTDVAAAFRLTAEHLAGRLAGDEAGEGALYAVVSGAPVSLRALGQAVETASGEPLKAVWGAKPYRADMPMRPGRMAPPPPGWTPAVSLMHGLREMAAHHRRALP